jgi:hypothetical protein
MNNIEKIIVKDEFLNIKLEIDKSKLDKLPKIYKGKKEIYCYCVNKNTSCFNTIKYKCNGYREYQIIK